MKLIRNLLSLKLSRKGKHSTSGKDRLIRSNAVRVDNLPLHEKYPGLNTEELYWLLENKELNEEELSENEERFLKDKGWMQLSRTLHREFTYGRSLAIEELVEGNYQILPDEFQNPFKETINFALLYFKGIQKEKPDEIDPLITFHFPIMHSYIKREISGEKAIILQNEHFNPQKGYDEFLMFSKNILVSMFPDETVRNEQIKKHFNNLHNDLISFIKSKKS